MKRELGFVPYLVAVTCLTLLTFGCANPAADAPEAAVSEPSETTATPVGAGETYVFGDDSSVGFVGSKVTGSHEGGFEAFEGTLTLVDNDPAHSQVEVVIDTTSLWADNDDLAAHLKSEEFFGVEMHPTATFTSTSIAAGNTTEGEGEESDAMDGEPRAGDTYTITGNLNLHGVTKQIAFPATIEVGEGSVNANAEFSIKRFDFEIMYPGRTDDLIRDDVLIKLDLRGVPAADAMMDDDDSMDSMDSMDEEDKADEGGEGHG